MASSVHKHLLPKPALRPLPMKMCAPGGGVLAALVVMFGTAVAFAPVPRITWEHRGEGAQKPVRC